MLVVLHQLQVGSSSSSCRRAARLLTARHQTREQQVGRLCVGKAGNVECIAWLRKSCYKELRLVWHGCEAQLISVAYTVKLDCSRTKPPAWRQHQQEKRKKVVWQGCAQWRCLFHSSTCLKAALQQNCLATVCTD